MRKMSFAVVCGILWLLYGVDAWACPLCNIHNYLHSTVINSENVFIAEIVEAESVWEAKAEVLRVISGDIKGTVIVQTGDLALAQDLVGKTIIFCQGMKEYSKYSWGPTFRMLPMTPEIEAEIQFLLRPGLPEVYGEDELPTSPGSASFSVFEAAVRKHNIVKNMDEAVELVQGISGLSRACGEAYIKQHRAEATKPLLAAIVALKKKLLSDESLYYGSWRMEGLIEALLIAPDKESGQFAQSEVEALLQGQEDDISFDDQEKLPNVPPMRAMCLAQWLRHAPENLRSQLRDQLLGKYSGLKGMGIAYATYALCYSKTARPSGLAKKLRTPEARDHAALGLHYAAWENTCVWSFEPAVSLYEEAVKIAHSPTLKAMLVKELEYAKDPWK